MNLEQITPTLIENTLQSIQQVEPFPLELFSLDLLQGSGAETQGELRVRLQDLFIRLISTSLTVRRNLLEIPTIQPENSTRPQLIESLHQDFSHDDEILEAWSALFYRYLSPVIFPMDDLAAAANVSVRQFRRRVEAGLYRLCDQLQRMELEAHTARDRYGLRRNLPPAENLRLFGLDGILPRLCGWLTDPNGPPLLSIEGLGGIGKTALAQAIARQLADNGTFHGLVWISARHEWMSPDGQIQPIAGPNRTYEDIIARLAEQLGQNQLSGLPASVKVERLKPQLGAEPYLVVVDNLETLADLQAIIPTLASLAGPSRFLLTSRRTLRQFPHVQVFQVPELSLKDSRDLLENELQRGSRDVLLTQSEATDIYLTTGGLPLGLKLVAGQLGRRPFQQVIEDLRQAQQSAPESLYKYIYYSTWELLSDPSRQLLLSMLNLSPDGETLPWIQTMSGLDDRSLDSAMQQLLDVSLVQVSGTLSKPLYHLHRVTTTFLQTEILRQWNAAPPEGDQPQ